eukprot:CAMPEP_0168624080 /NCGR_PEP_ID=MMETSP0449_2-20121227/9203_1 /TAXON_ID=1082188 /ORGANISM="Strombidium rassoulzadegani, Strain ras09" /LENGTH=41 /DNA_ID= /DNA_START= /DNA_END= /DNA_ORIENTATION=
MPVVHEDEEYHQENLYHNDFYGSKGNAGHVEDRFDPGKGRA